MRCNWILAKTQSGKISEWFRWDAMEFRLRHNLQLSWNNFVDMQWNFGQETIWNSHRYFQRDAIEFQLRQILELF